MAANGRLQGDHVLISDEKEANVVYNKGAYGLPQSGGALQLDFDEALYLVENNRLTIKGVTTGELVRLASSRERAFEIRYIVYRDLRARGFTVKPSTLAGASTFDYNVFARGALPGRTASKYLARCLSERDTLHAPTVAEDARRAEKAGKTLLLSLVDEEGDLTYYETRLVKLTAAIPARPERKARANLLEDRVIALDEKDAATLHDGGYFGRAVGFGQQLSLPEAIYLANEGSLHVEDARGQTTITPSELADRARALEPDFDLRQRLYTHLRHQGVVVKTGFKYGTHYRAYTSTPDEEHAPYLIHALQPDRAMPWPEVSGFVRLAHGVRKRLFFATPTAGDANAFDLLELARRKP